VGDGSLWNKEWGNSSGWCRFSGAREMGVEEGFSSHMTKWFSVLEGMVFLGWGHWAHVGGGGSSCPETTSLE
jgi:hypothetical protein